MVKNTDARQLLLDVGRKALLARGYDGVGLSAILSAAGVPKGSFYHFFRSKEEFALAVLETYEAHFVALRRAMFTDRSQPPFGRLKAYFAELERLHEGEAPLGGCLFGVLAQTASARSPGFRDRLSAVFATWTGQIAELLREAEAVGELDPHVEPAAAAAFLIEAYQGALVRMKAEGNMAAFGRFKRFALGTLDRRGSTSAAEPAG